MIDNPGQAERLLTRLQAALPVPARMTPELVATLRTPETTTEIPAACSIIALHYAGDEGGIVCGLDVAALAGRKVVLVARGRGMLVRAYGRLRVAGAALGADPHLPRSLCRRHRVSPSQ